MSLILFYAVLWNRSTFAGTSEQLNFAIYEIRSASRSDEGVYICVGKNEAGEDQKYVQLIVDNSDSIPKRGDMAGETFFAPNIL